MFYAAEDFESSQSPSATSTAPVWHRFLNALSRARPKELAHDYLDLDPRMSRGGESSRAGRSMADIDARQQQAAEQWRDRQQARERGVDMGAGVPHAGKECNHSQTGPENDLEP